MVFRITKAKNWQGCRRFLGGIFSIKNAAQKREPATLREGNIVALYTTSHCAILKAEIYVFIPFFNVAQCPVV